MFVRVAGFMNVSVFSMLMLMGIWSAEFSQLFVSGQNFGTSLAITMLVTSMTMNN